MSRILKFVVNIFLIAAILVAAAILIPPIAGVMTTIVDTPSMDTNLPLGSVTYSTDVDVRSLEPGDEILKDSDLSTYAYILRTCNPETGEFGAVSIADPEGREETIMLRNSVPKVAVMVPYIGYIMIAMHSLEGIIIIALVVVLMIILFVLSELWKPRDYEDEEPEMDVNAVIAAGLDPDDQSGIDTDAVRAVMEDNIAAVNRDTGEIETPKTWSEKRAAKKAQKRRAKEEREAAEAALPEAELPYTLPVDSVGVPDDRTASVGPSGSPDHAGSGMTAAADRDETVPVAGAGASSAAGAESGGAVSLRKTGGSGDGGDEIFRFGASEEAPKNEGHVSDVVAAVEEVMSGVVPEVSPDGAAEGAGIPDPEPQDEPEDGRFYRVPRLELDEILAQAIGGGENPEVKKDDNTGVTLVDFSDFF